MFIAMSISFVMANDNNKNSALNEVPESVMQEYYQSFIYDEEGVLVGALIEPLTEYLTTTEIKDMFISDVQQTTNNAINVFTGYKPKPRGCKSNNRWICQVNGTLGN